jgi:DNA invertase Pin-like site-specific DNA recombinase
MAEGRFIAYYRVSTEKQGASGLGIEGQKAAVLTHLNGGNWTLSAEFTEVESGKNSDRPQLRFALDHCRRIGATLLIARLDRLARNVAFISALMERGVPFMACDRPNASPFELHIYAAMAEEEARAISKRTKAALAAAKARGTVLGGYKGGPIPDSQLGTAAKRERAEAFAAQVRPSIEALRAEGKSLHQIAAGLTERGVLTARGSTWTATAVKRAIERGA